MPAFVKSNVGSLAGKSGLERTRVWPCRSKYSRNFSRISLPVNIAEKFSTPPNCSRTRSHSWSLAGQDNLLTSFLLQLFNQISLGQFWPIPASLVTNGLLTNTSIPPGDNSYAN